MTDSNQNPSDPFDPTLFGGLDDLPTLPAPGLSPAAAKEQAMSNAKKLVAEKALTNAGTLPADCPVLSGKEACAFSVLSERLRNTIVTVLEKQWPEAYAKYRLLKYPDGGCSTTLENRKRAYEFAFHAFLELTYKKSAAE